MQRMMFVVLLLGANLFVYPADGVERRSSFTEFVGSPFDNEFDNDLDNNSADGVELLGASLESDGLEIVNEPLESDDIICCAAARCNPWETFQCLLTRGAQINPCEYARAMTMYGFNRTLITFGLIDVNARDEYGRTALIIAALRDNIAMVHAAIAAGANVNAIDRHSGQTALMKAAARGYTEVVEVLIAAGADVNVADLYGRTALFLTNTRDFATIEVLIAARAQLTADRAVLQSALLNAANLGHTEIVLRLLIARANPDPYSDIATNLLTLPPLMYATMNNYTAMVTILRDAGARIDNVSVEGETALVLAARNNCIATVKDLLAAKANPHIINKNGETALMRAAQCGHSVVAQILIDEYYRRLLRPCPVMGKLIVRNSQSLIEQLPVECGQAVASLLAANDVLALRLASTHCLLYAQYEFERIKSERTAKLKGNLIEDIKSALPIERRTNLALNPLTELLERELARVERLNVATDFVVNAQQSVGQAVSSVEFSDDWVDSGVALELSGDSGAGVGGPAPRY